MLDVSVLLIEAGGDSDCKDATIPLACSLLQNTKRDWGYRTVPQQQSGKACVGQKSSWPRGKCLGGTSVLNYMAWVRGCAADYDSWAYNEGCKGWSWEDVLPLFKK